MSKKDKGTSRTTAATPEPETTTDETPRAHRPSSGQLLAAVRYLARETKRESEVHALLGYPAGE